MSLHKQKPQMTPEEWEIYCKGFNDAVQFLDRLQYTTKPYLMTQMQEMNNMLKTELFMEDRRRILGK